MQLCSTRYSFFLILKTDLNNDVGLASVLTVLQQCVRATAREEVVKAIKGLKVVLSPGPAGHLPFKSWVWD